MTRLLAVEAEGRACLGARPPKGAAAGVQGPACWPWSGAGARRRQQFLTPDPSHPGPLRQPGARLAWFQKRWGRSLDIAFPVVHGTHGEDGTLQGLFELADIPYVGPGVAASAAGMDKILSKLIFRGAGLPTVEAAWFTRRQWLADEAAAVREVESRVAYPVVVKPAVAGSSVGIARAANAQDS